MIRNQRASRPKLWMTALGLYCLGSTSWAAGAPEDHEQRMAAGFRAAQALCFSCHSPDASAQERIAPPLVAIKRHYSRRYPDEAGFTSALRAFVDDPSADNASMQRAVEKFGLMPKMSLDPDTVADIAYYSYHSPLEQPEWFSEHYPKEQARYADNGAEPPRTLMDYQRRGQQLAMQTKVALGSELKKALKQGGAEHAVSFCHTQALPITAAMSAQLNATIKRVSDRPRNPANAANDSERAHIARLQAQLANGEKPEPLAREDAERVVGYYPIVTNGMCLQCHGQPERDIHPATLAAIQASYPQDQATGYADNQLRGLFVVEMAKPAL